MRKATAVLYLLGTIVLLTASVGNTAAKTHLGGPGGPPCIPCCPPVCTDSARVAH